MVPEEFGYISEGDIVKVVHIQGEGTASDGIATSDKKYLNRVGLVVSENGCGFCKVIFFDGNSAYFWNAASLQYATANDIKESLEKEAVSHLKSVGNMPRKKDLSNILRSIC